MWILLKYLLLLSTMDWHSLLNIQTLGELVSLWHNVEYIIPKFHLIRTCCVLFATQIQDQMFPVIAAHIPFDFFLFWTKEWCFWISVTTIFSSILKKTLYYFQVLIVKIRLLYMYMKSVLCCDSADLHVHKSCSYMRVMWFFAWFLSWQTHFTGHGYHKQRSHLWMRYQTLFYLN